jgi:hypothetical protein
MIKKLVITLILIVALVSCKDDDPDPIVEEEGIYTKQFETIWKDFDRHYVFFDYKSIDWNAIHDSYFPKFKSINDYSNFINHIKLMLTPLRDVHVWIKKNNGQFVQPYFPEYFNNWDKNTWDNIVKGYSWHQVSSSWGWFKTDSIGYFTFSSWDKDNIHINSFDAALDSMRNCKGIIIDIRMNGGGYGPLAGDIGARFSADTFKCGFFRIRNGYMHNEFSDLIPMAYPKRGDWQFTKTVVVLIGRGCFSTSEIFAAGMSKLPNCITIGDTTGGGLSNSRQFTLDDGTTYSISDELIYDTEMNIVEGRGIAPKITVKYNAQDKTDGIDPVFTYALELLK